MRKLLGVLAGLLFFVSVAIGTSFIPAQAQPTGGFGNSGPTTLLGNDEFIGCHFLSDGEFASLNWRLGTSQAPDESRNFGNAAAWFSDAYNHQGGGYYTDGYAWAYALGLKQQADQGLTGNQLNASWEQNANNICAPWLSIPGNPNNFTDFINWHTTPGANGTVARWGGCGEISLDMDSGTAAMLSPIAVATLLSAESGLNVVYRPGYGAGASIYMHIGDPHDQFGNPVDGSTLDTFTNFANNPATFIFQANSTIRSSASQGVLLHEAGLAIGEGEPEQGPSGEIMSSLLAPGGPLYPQAGDWNSGIWAGVYYTACP